jgi:hypothetical protein
MNFYLVKNKHVIFKTPLHFDEKKGWNLAKNVLINELYKGKKLNGKKLFKINALLLPNYKNHFRAKKNKGNVPKMNFQICKFLSLFSPPYHALTH